MNIVLRRLLTFLIFIVFFLGVNTLPANAAFRFINWSDAQDNGSYLPTTSRQAASLNPNFTIFAGDFEPDGTTQAGLTTMTSAMNGISSGYPTSNGMFNKSFLVKGNHDKHISGSDTLWSSYMNNSGKATTLGMRNYTELNEDLTYSFDYDNARFIALDYPGYSTAQISWLNGRLLDAQNRADINHVFIYTHRPFYCVIITVVVLLTYEYWLCSNGKVNLNRT
jgi:hypothetical protein